MGRTAQWDTDLGYRLYLEGKSDHEIADECRVNTGTVTSYRLKRWRKNPDGGRGAPLDGAAVGTPVPGCPDTAGAVSLREERKEVAGMPMEIDESRDTAKMMEVIAKMTEGMGGIKAVCVGNIIQSLWNLNCVDDIRNARNILNWLEANYDFG
jgi:hypothetical protein